MIIYTEKGIGLHDAIIAAGHWLHQVDGVWQASDEAAVQAIIDGYPLAACQAEIMSQIDAHAKALRDGVVADISAAEMASWTIKQREAAAWQASGIDADAPMLALEAQARGTTVAVLAGKVLAKAAQLSTLEAMIAGTCGRHCDAVKALDTFAAVLAYDWHSGWPI